jgi:hypothetical protein
LGAFILGSATLRIFRRSLTWRAHVEYRFKSDEWQRLAPSERIYRCRLMAEEARRLAEHASAELKQGYLGLADQWSRLATDMEKMLAP